MIIYNFYYLVGFASNILRMHLKFLFLLIGFISGIEVNDSMKRKIFLCMQNKISLSIDFYYYFIQGGRPRSKSERPQPRAATAISSHERPWVKYFYKINFFYVG